MAALVVAIHDRLPWWKAREHPKTAGQLSGKQLYKLGLEQPFWNGKVALDKIKYDANNPGTLVISGRFIGCNPLEISVFGCIRETPDGAEKSQSLSSFSRPRDNGQMETAFSFEFQNAPVTAETLYCRIYGIQKGFKKPIPYALADFSFPNPLRLRVQPWKAEPLPATRIIGPLTVELMGVNSGPPEAVQSTGYSKLSLRVFEKGVGTYQWRLIGIECSSVLGDSYYGFGSAIGTNDIKGTLWKCLAPWKIKVSLIRDADFRPGEIIEIRDIPIPAEGQAISFNQKWEVAGQELKFVQIAKGEPQVRGWKRPMVKSSVTMHFTLPDQGYWSLKLLSVADAEGKVLWEPVEEFVVREKSNSRNVGLVFGPEMGPLPAKISCKFGVVWEKREAEFTVNPTYEGKPFRPKVEIQ